MIVISSPDLDNVTLLPATNVTSSFTPAPVPPDVKRIDFLDASVPSTADTEYVVLLSGVLTLPPSGIDTPLTVIALLSRALFGMFVRVLVEPEILQVLNVLFVIVWVAVR